MATRVRPAAIHLTPAAERRVAEFSRRAAALDLILGLMREKRT